VLFWKAQVQLLESEGVQFQNAGAVAAESFWRFPKDVDLEVGAKSSDSSSGTSSF